MYETWYAGIEKRFDDPARAQLLRRIDKALVYIVAAAYIAALIWLAVSRSAQFAKFLCVPAASFVIATVLRAAIDAPRPYERFVITPVLAADTTGKSCPSRHVASACAIACAFLWINPIAGIIGVVFAVGIACLRVIGGVHFPRDVIAAAALALVCAALGFLVIP